MELNFDSRQNKLMQNFILGGHFIFETLLLVCLKARRTAGKLFCLFLLLGLKSSWLWFSYEYTLQCQEENLMNNSSCYKQTVNAVNWNTRLFHSSGRSLNLWCPRRRRSLETPSIYNVSTSKWNSTSRFKSIIFSAIIIGIK